MKAIKSFEEFIKNGISKNELEEEKIGKEKKKEKIQIRK